MNNVGEGVCFKLIELIQLIQLIQLIKLLLYLEA